MEGSTSGLIENSVLNFPGGTEENHEKTLVMVVDVTAEIRAGHLENKLARPLGICLYCDYPPR